MDAETFAQAVRRQLDAMEISERVILTIGKRRTIKIRDKEVVGFEVILEVSPHRNPSRCRKPESADEGTWGAVCLWWRRVQR